MVLSAFGSFEKITFENLRLKGQLMSLQVDDIICNKSTCSDVVFFYPSCGLIIYSTKNSGDMHNEVVSLFLRSGMNSRKLLIQ